MAHQLLLKPRANSWQMTTLGWQPAFISVCHKWNRLSSNSSVLRLRYHTWMAHGIQQDAQWRSWRWSTFNYLDGSMPNCIFMSWSISLLHILQPDPTYFQLLWDSLAQLCSQGSLQWTFKYPAHKVFMVRWCVPCKSEKFNFLGEKMHTMSQYQRTWVLQRSKVEILFPSCFCSPCLLQEIDCKMHQLHFHNFIVSASIWTLVCVQAWFISSMLGLFLAWTVLHWSWCISMTNGSWKRRDGVKYLAEVNSA